MADAEMYAAQVKRVHGLSSLHIFDQGDEWRVFGFRLVEDGSYRASVAEGIGPDIRAALIDLDDSLKIGPIAAAKKREAKP